MDQVNEFKENLKIWAKEQAKESKERMKATIKNLKWSIDSASLRLKNAKRNIMKEKMN